MATLELDLLLGAAAPGGSTCLTSVTELAPAAGPHASVAPAKFASAGRQRTTGTYAYETRYLDGDASTAVLIDSKQSQLNRAEEALGLAIVDGHPTLSRMPRIVVTYDRDGVTEGHSDLELPHRPFDGHIRAGTVGGVPVTQLDAYRAIRVTTAPAVGTTTADKSRSSSVPSIMAAERSPTRG